MGNNVVWWPRRHSVARIHKVGDWMGLGTKAPLVTPFLVEGGGSPGEPVVKAENGMRVELERAARPVGVRRGPGRPRKP